MIKRQPKHRHTLGMEEQKETRDPVLINRAAATSDPRFLYLDLFLSEVKTYFGLSPPEGENAIRIHVPMIY